MDPHLSHSGAPGMIGMSKGSSLVAIMEATGCEVKDIQINNEITIIIVNFLIKDKRANALSLVDNFNISTMCLK